MNMLKELFNSSSREDITFASRLVAESVKDILNHLKEEISFNYYLEDHCYIAPEEILTMPLIMVNDDGYIFFNKTLYLLIDSAHYDLDNLQVYLNNYIKRML